VFKSVRDRHLPSQINSKADSLSPEQWLPGHFPAAIKAAQHGEGDPFTGDGFHQAAASPHSTICPGPGSGEIPKGNEMAFDFPRRTWPNRFLERLQNPLHFGFAPQSPPTPR